MTKNILNQGVRVGNVDVVVSSSTLMIVFSICMGLSVIVSSYLSAYLTASFTFDLQEDIFNKILSLSLFDFNKFGGSTLMTRTTSDVNRIQLFMLNALRSCLLLPFVIAGLIIATAYINLLLCSILVVAFIATILFIVVFSQKSIPLFNKNRTILDNINSIVREKITGIRYIRAFGRREYEVRKFKEINEKLFETSLNATEKIFFLTPVSLIIMNIAVVLMYSAGSIQIQSNLISISDLIIFFQYVTYFISSLSLIFFIVNLLPDVHVSSKRINEILNFEPSIINEPKDVYKEEISNKIEFKNVIFGYSGAKSVIADISFFVKERTTTAFIGAMGSGKSTVMYLLNRMYDSTFGEILIDGINIKDMDIHDLRSKISFTTQKTMVLQDTVFNNIAMGNSNISRDDAMDCCDLTLFSEVFEYLPNGLDSEMAQDGMNISGGQKQRLSLARTLAKDTEIYVFDDCFSALDLKTESKVMRNIKEELKDKTILMVAQKISTIIDADNIILLDEGKIIAQGTHNELLKSSNIYQEIYESQMYAQEDDLK
jgi:ATP-binding cassette subfamily B protein